MSSSNWCFLTCKRQVRWSGIPISWRIFHNLWWSTVKGFGIVNKAKVDLFMELSCFFDDPTDVGNLVSGSSAFSKTSLNIWKFTVHVLLKPGLENFKNYFTSVWDECNCAVVWAFFGIAFLWDWNENWPFPVLWHSLSLKNYLTNLLRSVFIFSVFSKNQLLVWLTIVCLYFHYILLFSIQLPLFSFGFVLFVFYFWTG